MTEEHAEEDFCEHFHFLAIVNVESSECFKNILECDCIKVAEDDLEVTAKKIIRNVKNTLGLLLTAFHQEVKAMNFPHRRLAVKFALVFRGSKIVEIAEILVDIPA